VAFDHSSVDALVAWVLERTGLVDAAPVAPVVVAASSDEPIAIVGMACRFPGANSLEDFWEMLDAGRHAIVEVPPDRWDVDAWYDPEPATAGKMYVRTGGFLDRVDTFDETLFGVRRNEAVAMDPQQRILLEVAWEALERSGIPPLSLKDSRTGVYIGIRRSDYDPPSQYDNPKAGVGAYLLTGNDASFAPGRISYTLGLRGPAVPINTACSSSLVAVHMASQSLRQGETDLALVGGVNLLLDPRGTVSMCQMQALSKDGFCKAFDAAADGYGRSEGCGIVVLKRLSDAQRDGDTILAMVQGSAVNHDGPSSGLTVPSGLAQGALIRQAQASAGVSPDQVQYIEAHGTGTPLGDPIEISAVRSAMGPRTGVQPLYMGSVKSNIGHLELAAGVAGLIKTVLSIHKGRIPAHLHLKQVNPELGEDLPIQFPTQGLAWPGEVADRCAGISSFGLSGTNAHVVLGAGPQAKQAPANDADRASHVLQLSAQS
jgi:acyl transferase domain-containing protein